MIKFEPIPNYGKQMTIEEYKNCIKNRSFIPYDGYGYYSTKNRMSDIIAGFNLKKIEKVIAEKEFDYVVWFNR